MAIKHMLVRVRPSLVILNSLNVSADVILRFFDLYSSLAAKSDPNLLRSKDPEAIRFRTRLRQNWFQTIHEIEELSLRRGHFGHNTLRRWRDLRPRLNIRNIDQSSDSRHSTPWGYSCHWRDCLCTKGSHHAFRVCTGCWGAFYCDAECQKL